MSLHQTWSGRTIRGTSASRDKFDDLRFERGAALGDRPSMPIFLIKRWIRLRLTTIPLSFQKSTICREPRAAASDVLRPSVASTADSHCLGNRLVINVTAMQAQYSTLFTDTQIRIIEVDPTPCFTHGPGPLFFEPLQLNFQRPICSYNSAACRLIARASFRPTSRLQRISAPSINCFFQRLIWVA